ncbi:hypothetical protein CMUS01_09550 [Colletotrichum musicola]|uniref:Uncharacterized protein n=1 Tax=Colletotrichum musicola TaxID=2175873 RepID=A0A8H6K7J7_9PEZI|nr:hypothetical protein CMUS01_09550 [Colletotrichum musicola]
MAEMQFLTGAPGFVNGSSEVNKADKEIPEMLQSQSRFFPSKNDQTKSIGGFPRLDTPENLQADLESLCRLQNSAPSSTSPSSAFFHLSPNAFDRLESLLADIRVARFSYDYITQSAEVTMVETTVHNQCNRGIGTILESAVERLSGLVTVFATAGHHEQKEEVDALQTVSRRLRNVYCDGAAAIVVPEKCYRAPDNQFIDRETKFPFPPFVVEISYSQSFENAKKKAEQYSTISDGHIRTVLIVDIEYPGISHMRLHLFATETAPTGERVSREVQSITLFDLADAAPPNPGPLRLFASDVLANDTEIPARLQRPLLFEGNGDGIVHVEIPSEDLRGACLKARELHLKKEEKAKNFWK